jgi:hypothetical protein
LALIRLGISYQWRAEYASLADSRLIARVPYGAVDIRIHARVVERTSDGRDRDRSGPAAANGALVVTALPGGDTTDDQPDDQKYRSDVHLDLRSIVGIKSDAKASAIAGLCLEVASGREAYPRAPIASPVRANSTSFPEIWKLAVIR